MSLPASSGASDRLAAARAALARAESTVGVAVPAPLPSGGPPLPGPLAFLPGGGLAPGTVTQVTGSTSLLLALAAAAAGEDGWCALAALPHLGWRAAAALGLDLERVIAVPAPGPDAPTVTGALVDGVDVLVLGPCRALQPRDRRSLAGRVRARGTVLLTAGEWAGAHLTLHAETTAWHGLGPGHLTGRSLRVRVSGRAAPPGTGEGWVRLGPHGLEAGEVHTSRPGLRLLPGGRAPVPAAPSRRAGGMERPGAS